MQPSLTTQRTLTRLSLTLLAGVAACAIAYQVMGGNALIATASCASRLCSSPSVMPPWSGVC
jgi:hypothetical protein